MKCLKSEKSTTKCMGVKLVQCCGPHFHTWILCGPEKVKKIKQVRLYISGPQTFLSADTGNQLITNIFSLMANGII